ncbi:MAG: DUF4845 domain-containing protein [Gammaproteobacteria bacterium]
MNLRHKQLGVTLSGLIMACIVIGGAALVGMKLWPIYNEKLKVDAAMQKLANSPEGSRMNARAMAVVLQKQFDVNDVEPVDPRQLYKYLKIVKRKGGDKEVTLAYEIRQPFFSNLDIIMNYASTVNLSAGKTD